MVTISCGSDGGEVTISLTEYGSMQETIGQQSMYIQALCTLLEEVINQYGHHFTNDMQEWVKSTLESIDY